MKRFYKDWIYFLALVFFAVLFRFPYFEFYVLNWDESSFILVGDAWRNGSLPYTELWDMKQPMLFAFFGAVISVFGKSIFMIRLMGALAISVSAFFVYLIGKKLASRQVGLFSGILYVFSASVHGASQSVMSEQIAVLFLMPGIYVLMSAPRRMVWFFAGGFLLGLSCLVRLNIAFVPLLLGIYFIFKPFQFVKNIYNNLLFTAGFVLSFFLSFLMYYMKGYGEIWWETVIVATFHYGNSQEAANLISIKNHLILLSMIGVLWGGFYYLMRVKKISIPWIYEWMILLLCVAGIELSFLKSGNIFLHYLIQIYPFLSLFAVYGLSLYLEEKKYSPKLIFRIYAILTMGLIFIMAYKFYSEDWKEKEQENLAIGEISNYLNGHLNQDEQVYITNYHIIYWLIDKKPLSKATTHPSNITKTYLFPFMNEAGTTSLEKLEHIFQQEPSFILTEKKVWYFDEELQESLDQELGKEYKLVLTAQNGLLLYKRQ